MKKDDVKKDKNIVFRKANKSDDDFDYVDDADFEDLNEVKHIKVSKKIDDYENASYDDYDSDDAVDYDEDDYDDDGYEKKRTYQEKRREKKILRKQNKNLDDSENSIDIEDIRAERKKLKKNRKLKRILACTIVLAVAGGLYFSKNVWIPKLEGILDKPKNTIVNDGVLQSGNFPIDTSEGNVNILDKFDNNIVIANESKLYFYDENGNVDNSFAHGLGTPMFKMSEKRILAFDNFGYTFKTYNKKGEILKKTLEDQILYADISSTGLVLVVTQTEKYVSVMTVYDSNGSEIYHWSSGQRIVDSCFVENGSGCYISTFSSNNGEISSKLNYIEFDKSETLMTSEDLSGLVVDSCVNDNGNIWAVSDEEFYLIDKDGKIIDSYEYTSDMVSYSLSDECASVVLNGLERETAKLAIFDSESDNATPIIVNSDKGAPKKVICDLGKVYLLSRNSFDSYNTSGNLLATSNITTDYANFVYKNRAVYFVGARQLNKILFEN